MQICHIFVNLLGQQINLALVPAVWCIEQLNHGQNLGAGIHGDHDAGDTGGGQVDQPPLGQKNEAFLVRKDDVVHVRSNLQIWQGSYNDPLGLTNSSACSNHYFHF